MVSGKRGHRANLTELLDLDNSGYIKNAGRPIMTSQKASRIKTGVFKSGNTDKQVLLDRMGFSSKRATSVSEALSSYAKQHAEDGATSVTDIQSLNQTLKQNLFGRNGRNVKSLKHQLPMKKLRQILQGQEWTKHALKGYRASESNNMTDDVMLVEDDIKNPLV